MRVLLLECFRIRVPTINVFNKKLKIPNFFLLNFHFFLQMKTNLFIAWSSLRNVDAFGSSLTCRILVKVVFQSFDSIFIPNYIIDYRFYMSGYLPLDICQSRYLPVKFRPAFIKKSI